MKEGSIKILFVIDSLVRGGRERRLIELVKRLSVKPNYQLELLLLSDRIEYPEIHDLNINLHIINRSPKKDPRVFFKLYKLVKRLNIDVLHSWGSMPSIYCLPTVKLLNIPFLNAFIADAALGMDWRHPDYLRGMLTFPFSDLVVGNSRAGLKAYNAPQDKSRCVYNGFDADRVKDLDGEAKGIREKFNIPNLPVIGMVGGFFVRKDYHTYIRAALRVLESGKEAIFFAVGDGPLQDEVQQLVSERWAPYFRFTGRITDVEQLLTVFDIGVLSTNSAVHGEGISNSILEYMWLGISVVATEGGGTDEIVFSGENGYKVAFDDDADMANKVLDLLNDDDLRKKLGSNGQKMVHKKFALGRMVDEYEDIYRELLSVNLKMQSV